MQSIGYGALILVLVAFAMYRRMRPQPVRPQRVLIMTAVIVVLSALNLVGNNRLTAHPLAVILAIPALLLGFGGGLLLMQSIHFWREPATGALWMKGGVVYLAVWLGTVLLRQAITYANTGTTGQQSVNPGLAVLSADLVIVSIGLWIARAVALVRKYELSTPMTTAV